MKLKGKTAKIAQAKFSFKKKEVAKILYAKTHTEEVKT
jgi:hypothetical protein